jgi:hypothetical protein
VSLHSVEFNVNCEGCAFAIAGNIRQAFQSVSAVFVAEWNENAERFDNRWTHTNVSRQASPKPMACPEHGVPIDFRLQPSEQRR